MFSTHGAARSSFVFLFPTRTCSPKVWIDYPRPAAWVDRPHTNKTRPRQSSLLADTHSNFPKGKHAAVMDILFSRKNRSFYFFLFLILSVLRERWFSKWFSVFTACPNKSGSKLKKIFLVLGRNRNKMRSPQTLPHGGVFYSRVTETTWRKFLLLPLLFVFISLVAMDAETIVVSLYTYTRRYRLCWPACKANCAL